MVTKEKYFIFECQGISQVDKNIIYSYIVVLDKSRKRKFVQIFKKKSILSEIPGF